MFLDNLTNGTFFRLINFYRIKLKVSVSEFCKLCHISTASYYKMRHKELKFQVYLRIFNGLLILAGEEDFNATCIRCRRVLIADPDE